MMTITRDEMVRMLMHRDKISRNDAEIAIDDCLRALDDCKGNYDMAADIVYLYLGLEPDYIGDLMNWR